MFVTGENLPKHIGKRVAVTGYVQASGDEEIVLLTTDDKTIKIKTNSFDVGSHDGGLVQVFGECVDDETILSEVVVLCDDSSNSKFQKQKYNKMVEILSRVRQ